LGISEWWELSFVFLVSNSTDTIDHREALHRGEESSEAKRVATTAFLCLGAILGQALGHGQILLDNGAID
jgi:hypothetical protein